MPRLMTTQLTASAVIGAMMIAAAPAQAATIFTDRAAFESALAGTITNDGFDNDIATADTITFDSGVTATKSTPGVPPTLNRVSAGDYDGFVQRDGFRNITFDFGGGVQAFGGDFSDISSLFVNADVDGAGVEQFDIAAALGASSGFFGIIGTVDFSSLFFTTLAGTVLTPGAAPFGGETFSLDNLTIATDINASAVPLPAALPLMLAGLGAFGFASRGKKQKAA